MIDQHFVILGAVLSISGSIGYAWQTVRGRTRPNRITWFMWATAPIIGFFAELDHGVGLPSIMTLSVGLGPAIILVSSFFNPAGFWRLTRFDFLCGAVSVLALVVWLSLDNPTLAVVFAVLADLMGGVPTLRKVWSAPQTERPGVFALSGANAAITLFTIRDWTPAAWAFPVYIVAICAVLCATYVLRSRTVHERGVVVAGH